MPKRTIGDYETDVLAIADIVKALRLLSPNTTKRVLRYIVKRELGEAYDVQFVGYELPLKA